MPIAQNEFVDWLSAVGKSSSPSELSRISGMNRTTVQAQLRADQVPETTVLLLARKLGLDPLDQLSTFTPYQDLVAGTQDPSLPEVMSQLNYWDIADEMSSRAGRGVMQPGSDPWVLGNGLRDWIQAIDPGGLRGELSARFGVLRPNVSAMITKNRMPMPMLVEAARVAQVSLASGLVVTGLLSLGEGRWPTRVREDVLGEISDLELVDLLAEKLAAVRKELVSDTGTRQGLWSLALGVTPVLPS
jgi:hypothetical protein